LASNDKNMGNMDTKRLQQLSSVVRYLINFPGKMHMDLKVLSAKQGKSMSFLVVQAVREFLIKHRKGEG
jgi:hypothetical protein